MHGAISMPPTAPVSCQTLAASERFRHYAFAWLLDLHAVFSAISPAAAAFTPRCHFATDIAASYLRHC